MFSNLLRDESFLKDQIFDLCKFKAFADELKMKKKIVLRTKKHVGKGETAQCFLSYQEKIVPFEPH